MHLIHTIKRYISEAELTALAEGDTWFIDANDGESISVVVTSVTSDAYYLESVESASFAFARLERSEVPQRLYEPFPENVLIH